MKNYDYDVIVIGAGPGGLAASKVLATNKKRVLLVDKEPIGGTCLNYGCMPTKYRLKYGADSAAMEQQRAMVQSLNQAIEKNFKSLGVEVKYGWAVLKDEHTVSVEGKIFTTEYVVLAIGSEPKKLPGLEFDGNRIFSAEQLLWYWPSDRIKKMQIIGAGAIGIEFAFMFNSLADKITVCDIAEEILPREDKEVASRLRALMQKQGIEFRLGQEVSQDTSAEVVLVGIGRSGKKKQLEEIVRGIDIEVNAAGFIKTDDFLRTSVSNIFAAGECIGRQFFAHTALFEGSVAAMNILGRNVALNYPPIPRVVFSNPPLASVGAKGDDLVYGSINFPHGEMFFLEPVMGRMKIGLDKKGIVKFAAIFGPGAAELITLFNLAILKQVKLEELKKMLYVHPTVAEAIGRFELTH